MTDGLSQLAARGRRTREIPPPRNPARTAPVQLTSVLAPAPEEGLAAAPTPAVEAPAAEQAEAAEKTQAVRPAARRGPKLAPAPAAKTKAKAEAELKVVAVYLEQDDDDFLETITSPAAPPSRRPPSPAALWSALPWNGDGPRERIEQTF